MKYKLSMRGEQMDNDDPYSSYPGDYDTRWGAQSVGELLLRDRSSNFWGFDVDPIPESGSVVP